MKRCWLKSAVPFMTMLLLCCWYAGGADAKAQEKAATGVTIKLPSPILDGTLSVEKALSERRSARA